MNTPGHMVLSLAVAELDPGREAPPRWVLAGAVLPDAPMFLFYLVQKLGGTPESVIWQEAYFREDWQRFFDLFNSIPLAVAGLLIALRLRARTWAWLFAAVLLHCAADLPLHADDGHRHFYPLSSWRFDSPVSYWDPTFHGRWAALGEMALALACCTLLWKRYPRLAPRIFLALCALSYLSFYTGFYILG